MTVGIPTGILLKIRLNRASQSYNLPVHLSDDILFQPLFYGTVAPVLAWYAFKKLILDPWETREMQKIKDKKDQEKIAQ